MKRCYIILILALLVAPTVSAQSTDRTLYNFYDDGDNSSTGLSPNDGDALTSYGWLLSDAGMVYDNGGHTWYDNSSNMSILTNSGGVARARFTPNQNGTNFTVRISYYDDLGASRYCYLRVENGGTQGNFIGTITGQNANNYSVYSGGWNTGPARIKGWNNFTFHLSKGGDFQEMYVNEELQINDSSPTLATWDRFVIETVNNAGCGWWDNVFVWSGRPDQQPQDAPPGAPDNNITIQARNLYDAALIVNSTVTVSNNTYFSSHLLLDGTVRLNISNGTYWFNFSDDTYFNSSFQKAIVFQDTIVGNLTQSIVNVSAREWLTNNSLNVSTASLGTYANSTGGPWTSLIGGSGDLWLNVTVSGYLSNESTRGITNRTIHNYTVDLYTARVRVDAFDLPNGTAIDTFTITFNSLNYTFTQSIDTTVGNATIHLINGTWNVSIDAPNHLAAFELLNVTEGGEAHNVTFNIYATNTVNITFKHEVNLSLMDFLNITVDLISDDASYTFNISTGNLFKYLITPADYTVRYAAPLFGYADRFYEFSLLNRTYNELTLYMLEDIAVSNVTLTVVDQNNQPFEGAEVRVLRYNVATNAYTVTETPVTDFEGKTQLHLQLGTEYYKFQIYSGSTLLKTTNPAYITSTTLSLQVSTGATGGDYFYSEQSVSYSLNFTTSTNNFNFEYSDGEGTTSQGCLAVYTLTPLAETLYNNSCISAASGAVLVHVEPINGTTYQAYGYVVYSSTTHYLTTLSKAFKEVAGLGGLGIFLTFALVIVFALVGIWNPTIAIILTGSAPLLVSIAGLNEIPLVANISIFVAALVLAAVVGSRGGL